MLKKVKFRFHRGGLAESLATTIEVESMNDLLLVLRNKLSPYGFQFKNEDVEIEQYGYDERINWDTHIVTIKEYGVIGFTNKIINDKNTRRV